MRFPSASDAFYSLTCNQNDILYIKLTVLFLQCTQCIIHAGLAHAHNIEYYLLVKVVNNASGTRLAGKLSTDWNAKPYRIRIM